MENEEPKKRRRRRKRVREDLNIEEEKNFRRIRQKEYSKINRKRKKNYFEHLEHKVKFLESEVERLNCELWKAKREKISENSGFHFASTELFDAEEIIKDRIKSMETGPFRNLLFSDMKEMVNETLLKEESRLNQFNYHFDLAMESLLMNPEKLLIYISQNLSDEPNKDYAQVSS